MNNKLEHILNMVDLLPGSSAEMRQKSKRSFIENVKHILPKQIQNKDRFALMFEEVVNAKIKDQYVTNKASILPCVFQSAKFGLYPDPAMGQIYFIPYKGNLTYQLGYKGMIQLAKNSGLVSDIRAGLVYKKEVESSSWEYFEDERGQHFRHVPSMEKDKGDLYCGYSIVSLADGKPFIHVMEAHRIDEIKKIALARTPRSPWGDALALPEMQKKTVIRRHCKTMTLSPDLVIASEYEEAIERGEDVAFNKQELESVIDGICEKSEVPTIEDDSMNQPQQAQQTKASF